jgi:hypothetical protein
MQMQLKSTQFDKRKTHFGWKNEGFIILVENVRLEEQWINTTQWSTYCKLGDCSTGKETCRCLWNVRAVRFQVLMAMTT